MTSGGSGNLFRFHVGVVAGTAFGCCVRSRCGFIAIPALGLFRTVRAFSGISTATITPQAIATLFLWPVLRIAFGIRLRVGGLLALGAMPEPQSGQMMEDLDLAQVRIEVLGLLQSHLDATLAPEARKGFEDVLYQLRMLYLQKSKVAKL